ncbi:MAG: hypothetical protein ACXW1M_06645 [Acidimicrobiia bacterium]
MVAALVLKGAAAMNAVVAAADPSKVGDLSGNLPLAVYLLIPIAIVLAMVTALVLGASGEAATARRRAGGVSRTLRRESDRDQAADPGPPV